MNKDHKCTKCGQPKTRNEMATDTRRKNGLSPWCRDCQNGHARKRRAELKAGTRPNPAERMALLEDIPPLIRWQDCFVCPLHIPCWERPHAAPIFCETPSEEDRQMGLDFDTWEQTLRSRQAAAVHLEKVNDHLKTVALHSTALSEASGV